MAKESFLQLAMADVAMADKRQPGDHEFTGFRGRSHVGRRNHQARLEARLRGFTEI